MKVVVLGTSEFTLCCTRALLDSGVQVCALISMPKEVCPLNSVDIFSFAKEKRISYHEFSEINSSQGINCLKSYSPEYVFSFWPRMMSKEVINIPKVFTIGAHPTALPFNRGRHPLHWAICLGLSETKLSFFVIDEGVDSGRILLQVPVKIERDIAINALNNKINVAVFEGVKEICRRFSQEPLYNGVVQDHSVATSWRKRTSHDVILDMRMSADMILRIVRSFTSPYLCANLIFEKHVIKVSKALIVRQKDLRTKFEYMEHGKIFSVKGNKIKVKVNDAIVELECGSSVPASLTKAIYIHPPSKYLLKWPGELANQLR